MTTLDTVLRVLPEQARKAYPGRKFRFSTNFFDDSKEPVYQVVMTSEQGMAGTVFFCQGESPLGTDAAAAKLVESFVAQLRQDGEKQIKAHDKVQGAFRDLMIAQGDACRAAEALLPAYEEYAKSLAQGEPPAVESGT